MSKRSYFKEKTDLEKDQKPFYYINSNGKEFGNINLDHLTDDGKSMVKKFIKEYDNHLERSRQLDEQIYKYKHSKPTVDYNKWKYNKPYGNYFSSAPADKVHSFKKEIKRKYGEVPTFIPNKFYGDYFNKIDLSIEFDKFKQ